MLSDTNSDTKRKRRSPSQEDEGPSLIIGIDRNDPTELKLSVLKNGKWTVIKEDTFAIIRARVADMIYSHVYLGDS